MASKSKGKRGNKSKNSKFSYKLKSFFSTSFGHWIAGILLIIVLLSVNALIAAERLDLFLLLNAIELIIAMIVIWTRILRQRSS